MSANSRYVLLGLARARSQWFGSVSQWTTSAAIPAEFFKCVSADEMRARLGSNRSHSAALLDGSMPLVDRDLIETCREAGCAVIIIDDGRRHRDWIALGASAVLPSDLEREALLDSLVTHAEMLGSSEALRASAKSLPSDIDLSGFLTPGSVIAVCGPGGTGASTLAAALAQGLGHRAQDTAGVLLADLALHAEQAMLHDVRDVVPGVQELVEAHRIGSLGASDVRALTFEVIERQYHLLLGLRQARYWPTLRPHAFHASLASLRRTFDIVVCDITADFEGAGTSGSVDIDERNLMARHTAVQADVIFVVGRSGVKGLHSLVRVMTDLISINVPIYRIIPVINESSGRPSQKAQLAKSLQDLMAMGASDRLVTPPLFVPARPVEHALRDAVRLPAPIPALMAGAYRAVVDRVGSNNYKLELEPQLVAPGSIGTWPTEEQEY